MNTYIRKGRVELPEAMARITEHLHSRDKIRVEIQGHNVGVTSLRLKTFARDYNTGNGLLRCVTCGLHAAFFAVEVDAWNKQPNAQDKPHMNLYGVNEGGEEVLFTHDHILARGLGGRDALVNTQTMCSPCNYEKSKQEQEACNRIRATKEKP